MAAVMLSQSVAEAMIISWRRSRLSTIGQYLGYPTENVLAKAGAARTGRPPPLPDGELTDAEIVQSIVEQMSNEIRTAFEARHLALIRGQRCLDMPQKARALRLGIPIRTYWYRVDAGHRIVALELGNRVDLLHS